MRLASLPSRSSYSSSGGLPELSFSITPKSMPAQKLPPAPVRIATRSSSSWSRRCQASLSPHSTSAFTAFFFAGRLMVTVRTWPTFSASSTGSGTGRILQPVPGGAPRMTSR